MSTNRVARRYADAAIEYAEEKKQSERLAADLELIQRTIKESRDLQVFLKSPVIPKERKRSALAELFNKSVSPLTLEFLNLLVDKGREDVLDSILVEYFRLRDEQLGIMTLDLRAAVELSKDQQASISRKFEEMTKKKIRIAFSVDKQLKGGFVARVGDTVFDGSLQRQLELLRERFDDVSGRN